MSPLESLQESKPKIPCDIINRDTRSVHLFQSSQLTGDAAAIGQCCHSHEHSSWDLDRHCVRNWSSAAIYWQRSFVTTAVCLDETNSCRK